MMERARIKLPGSGTGLQKKVGSGWAGLVRVKIVNKDGLALQLMAKIEEFINLSIVNSMICPGNYTI